MCLTFPLSSQECSRMDIPEPSDCLSHGCISYSVSLSALHRIQAPSGLFARHPQYTFFPMTSPMLTLQDTCSSASGVFFPAFTSKPDHPPSKSLLQATASRNTVWLLQTPASHLLSLSFSPPLPPTHTHPRQCPFLIPPGLLGLFLD